MVELVLSNKERILISEYWFNSNAREQILEYWCKSLIIGM